MMNLYAPWCGHCQDLEPEWASAASILKGQVKLGKLDATVEVQTADTFNIKTYPMIIALSPYDKETIVTYDGPLDAASIVDFGLLQLEEFGVLVEIRQVTSNDVVVNCKARKACVIGFLPHILDTSTNDRNEHIKRLQKAASKYRRQPVTFYWAQAGDFLGFENSLDLGFGYPALVLVSLEKERYTVMRNAFQEVEIDIFVAKALRGQISFNHIRKLPVLEEVEAWDGLRQATNSKEEDL